MTTPTTPNLAAAAAAIAQNDIAMATWRLRYAAELARNSARIDAANLEQEMKGE